MKLFKNIIVKIILLLVGIQYTNAQAFIKKDGAATDIAISPTDGSVYVVGASKNVLKYDIRSKKFKPFGNQSKNVKSISVHSNGSLYMVSTSNEVYINVNGRWNKIPGIKTNEVDIDKNGNVRALNLSGRLYNLYQGKWQPKSLVNKNNSGFNQLIGKDSKTLYARFKNNNFKQFKSGKWVSLNGSPLKITIDDKTGDVYAVGRNKGIYKWENSKWVLLKHTRKDFKDVAVNNSKIWTITNDKSIYYYDKNKKEEVIDYSGTYKVSIIKIMSGTEGKDIYGTAGVYLNGYMTSGNTLVIPPKDKQPNRYLDIPKSESRKTRSSNRRVKKYLHLGGGESSSQSLFLDGELDIDKSREFVVDKDAAKTDLVFDFQFNLKIKDLDEHPGEWQRVKIKPKDIILGKECIIQLDFPWNSKILLKLNRVFIIIKIEKK